MENGIDKEESFKTTVDNIINVATEHINELEQFGGELHPELKFVQGDDPSLRRVRISKIKNMPLNSPIIDQSAQRISACISPHRVKATNYSRGVLNIDYKDIPKLGEDLLKKERELVNFQYNNILKEVNLGEREDIGHIFCVEYTKIDFNNSKEKLVDEITKNENLKSLLSFKDGNVSNLHKVQIGNIISIVHKSSESNTIYGVTNSDPWTILVWLLKRILRTT